MRSCGEVMNCVHFQWQSFMKIGEDVETSEIEDIISAQKPEEAALLIYTVSGRGLYCVDLMHALFPTVWDHWES